MVWRAPRKVRSSFLRTESLGFVRQVDLATQMPLIERFVAAPTIDRRLPIERAMPGRSTTRTCYVGSVVAITIACEQCACWPQTSSIGHDDSKSRSAMRARIPEIPAAAHPSNGGDHRCRATCEWRVCVKTICRQLSALIDHSVYACVTKSRAIRTFVCDLSATAARPLARADLLWSTSPIEKPC